jgi:hypothetical protein
MKMKSTPVARMLFALPMILAGVAASPAVHAQGGTTESTSAPAAGAGTAYGGGSFGQAGQWVYSIAGEGDFPFWLSKTGGSDWSVAVRPAVDTFIIRSVSVGGIITLRKDGGYSDVGVGVRAGYNIPITSLVSFWARGGVYFHHYSQNNGPSGGQTSIGINAPFLFHVLPHAFVGVGPFFSVPVQNSDAMAGSDSTFGLTAVLGGWL